MSGGMQFDRVRAESAHATDRALAHSENDSPACLDVAPEFLRKQGTELQHAINVAVM